MRVFNFHLLDTLIVYARGDSISQYFFRRSFIKSTTLSKGRSSVYLIFRKKPFQKAIRVGLFTNSSVNRIWIRLVSGFSIREGGDNSLLQHLFIHFVAYQNAVHVKKVFHPAVSFRQINHSLKFLRHDRFQ